MEQQKNPLDTINQELEDAMTRLTESNRRVDELLYDYSGANTAETRTEASADTQPVAGEPHDSTATTDDEE